MARITKTQLLDEAVKLLKQDLKDLKPFKLDHSIWGCRTCQGESHTKPTIEHDKGCFYKRVKDFVDKVEGK